MKRALITLLFLMPSTVLSVEVTIPQTPLWAKSNNTGIAFDLLNLIDSHSEQPLTYTKTSLPLIRAIGNYVHGKTDCFMGADEVIFTSFYGMNIISSQAIKPSAILAFTLPGTKPIKSFEDMKGNIAGIPFGGDIAEAILKKHGIRTTKGKDFRQLMQLLKRRRISSIVSPDLEQYNHPELEFSKDFAVLKYTDRIHCHPSPKAAVFIKQFDTSLQKLKENGALLKLFSPQ